VLPFGLPRVEPPGRTDAAYFVVFGTLLALSLGFVGGWTGEQALRPGGLD
jgi:hypothetical protein